MDLSAVDVAVLRVENGLAGDPCELRDSGAFRSQTAREAINTSPDAMREPRLAFHAIPSRVIPDCGLALPYPAGFHSHASPLADAQTTLRGESAEDTWDSGITQAPTPFRTQLRVKKVKDASNPSVKDTGEQSVRDAGNLLVKDAGNQSVQVAGGRTEVRAAARRSVKDHRQQKKGTAGQRGGEGEAARIGRERQVEGDATAPPDRRSAVGAAGSMLDACTTGSGIDGEASPLLLPPEGTDGARGLGFSDEGDALRPSRSDSPRRIDAQRQAMTEDASPLPSEDDEEAEEEEKKKKTKKKKKKQEEDAEEKEAEAEAEEAEDEAEGALPLTVPSQLLRMGASEADVEKMLSRRPRLAQAEAPGLPAVVSLLRSHGISTAHVVRAAVNCPFWVTCTPGAVEEVLGVLTDAGEWWVWPPESETLNPLGKGEYPSDTLQWSDSIESCQWIRTPHS